MTHTPIRVVVVDDSALMRKVLTDILSEAPDIEVVGSAPDPYVARDKIKLLNPDVLTLDVEMPRMDGLTFLRNLMRLRPMPVVMVSTLTEAGADVTLEALACGAVDFVAKPKTDVTQSLANYATEIQAKVRMAARAKVQARNESAPKSPTAGSALGTQTTKLLPIGDKVIAIGASTGGTEAIKDVLRPLPVDTPPVVITQHLPLAYSESFARHVDQIAQMSVRLAQDGATLMPGNVYIAPGDQHLTLQKSGARYVIRLSSAPPVHGHRPAVDVMFGSVADCVGGHALAVLLTGMGKDGALGMQSIHERGGPTIVQDEATSVVWGMPGEAYRLGCADLVVPLPKIGDTVLKILNDPSFRAVSRSRSTGTAS